MAGSSEPLVFRFATVADVPLLARMNRELDEEVPGAACSLSQWEIEEKIRHRLASGYVAVLFYSGGETLGYCLYQHREDHVFVEHLYVVRGHRRQGLGRRVMQWMIDHHWRDVPRVIAATPVHHRAAIDFYHALGFRDDVLTLVLPLINLPDRA